MGKRILIAFIPQKKAVNNLIKIRKIAGIKSKRFLFIALDKELSFVSA